MPKTTATATATPCAHCAGDRAALHADTCPVRATRAIDSALASIEARTRAAIDAQLGAVLRTEPYATTPPPVTHKAPLAELRAMKLQPFAIWTHDGDGYLDVPTIWARDGAAAIRQLAATRDPGAKVTDRHGRKPSARTRELRVVWSSGFDTGLLRADVQPWPTEPEPLPVVRPGLSLTDAEAARFAARAEGYARQYLGGGGAFPASIPAIKARLASCALPPRDEWMGEIGAAIARLAPEYEADERADALRSLVAFTVSTDERQVASCVVIIPARACDLRQGRVIVYQLAAWVERFVGELGPVLVRVNTTMDTIGGLRGGVSIHVRPDVNVEAGVRCLHAAAAAVLPEIKAVV